MAQEISAIYDMGRTFTNNYTCVCGEDVQLTDITKNVTIYHWDETVDVIVCLWWHRLCYIRKIREVNDRSTK